MPEEISDERINIAVRRIFTVRRRQFGNFPNYPLLPLVNSVMNELQKTMERQWTQEDHNKIKEYILDNLDISAALPAE